MSAKGEYMSLLELGELQNMYPHLTGVWEEDSEYFTQLWEANREVFKELDVDYEELGDEN